LVAKRTYIVDVGLERIVELLRRDIENGGLGVLPRGIAHEDIDAAELADGVGYELVAERLSTQFARKRDGLASGSLDERDDFLRIRLFDGQVIDRDVGAFPGEGDRRGAAHPGVAASDQRLAPHQPAGAFVTRLA
jgi:hypothetical protein